MTQQNLMDYFEIVLGDSVERKGDRFVIKCHPKKTEHKFRLPLLPKESKCKSCSKNYFINKSEHVCDECFPKCVSQKPINAKPKNQP